MRLVLCSKLQKGCESTENRMESDHTQCCCGKRYTYDKSRGDRSVDEVGWEEG